MLVQINTIFNPSFGQTAHTVDADMDWLSRELNDESRSFISVVDTESNLVLVVPRHSIVSIKAAAPVRVPDAAQN